MPSRCPSLRPIPFARSTEPLQWDLRMHQIELRLTIDSEDRLPSSNTSLWRTLRSYHALQTHTVRFLFFSCRLTLPIYTDMTPTDQCVLWTRISFFLYLLLPVKARDINVVGPNPQNSEWRAPVCPLDYYKTVAHNAEKQNMQCFNTSECKYRFSPDSPKPDSPKT